MDQYTKAIFSHRIDFRVILRPKNSILSLSSFLTFPKDLLAAEHTKADRMSPQQHYDKLKKNPSAPMVVAGVRNVLANVRCIAYSKAMCDQFQKSPGTLAMVSKEVENPKRPYHAFRFANGRYSIDEFMPSDSLEGTEWLITGTPVLWNCDEEELFNRMITDAADHSHIWRLYRGKHPKATDETRGQWDALQEIFIDHLSSDRDPAAVALKKKAKEYHLPREEEYLHSVWGVNAEGEVIIVIAHGKLEAIGEIVKQYGALRAICVENSGSCAVYFVPDDPAQPWKLLVCAPNFRPRGTAFVFFELADANYAVIPSQT